jgi:hypothetical protein
MSEFVLDTESLDKIQHELVDLEFTLNYRVILNPAVITTSLRFPRASDFPISPVCLTDAIITMKEANYAYREALANKLWFAEKAPKQDMKKALAMQRYYLIDVSIRLYSAAEHLANSLIFMLEIEDKDLEPYKNKYTSQQRILGKFLKKERNDFIGTKEILKLACNRDWFKTIKLRNEYTHAQPPTIEGLGTIYKRRNRWVQSKDNEGNITYTTGMGSGDQPDYKIDEIDRFVKGALFLFADVLAAILKIYAQILEERGFKIENNKVSFYI